MMSARPPNAPTGRPPPITLPKVIRSGDHPSCAPSSPYMPDRLTRNPVITSSVISSAPSAWAASASPALKPASGGTTPMFAAAASVITAAISPGWRANASRTAARSLYGSTITSAVVALVTPAESGSANVATPEPAEASRASTCPW